MPEKLSCFAVEGKMVAVDILMLYAPAVRPANHVRRSKPNRDEYKQEIGYSKPYQAAETARKLAFAPCCGLVGYCRNRSAIIAVYGLRSSLSLPIIRIVVQISATRTPHLRHIGICLKYRLTIRTFQLSHDGTSSLVVL